MVHCANKSPVSPTVQAFRVHETRIVRNCSQASMHSTAHSVHCVAADWEPCKCAGYRGSSGKHQKKVLFQRRLWIIYQNEFLFDHYIMQEPLSIGTQHTWQGLSEPCTDKNHQCRATYHRRPLISCHRFHTNIQVKRGAGCLWQMRGQVLPAAVYLPEAKGLRKFLPA